LFAFASSKTCYKTISKQPRKGITQKKKLNWITAQKRHLVCVKNSNSS
jgi:hypothetical protein